MKERIVCIDVAKGFAILCVVIGHVLGFGFYGEQNVGKSLLFNVIYSFHMPLFVFLSGYVSFTVIKKDEILHDSIKRFRSLIVPGIIIGLLTIRATSFSDIIDFFTNSFKYGFWYVFVLFAFYILSYITNLSNINGMIKNSYVMYVVVAFVWYYVYRHIYIVPDILNKILCLDLIVRYYPYFFVGNLIRKHGFLKIIEQEWLFCVSVVWVLLSASIVDNNSIKSILSVIDGSHFASLVYTTLCTFLLYINAFSIIMIIMYIVQKVLRINSLSSFIKIFTFLGKNTLYIYLFHFFFIYAIDMPDLKLWFQHNSFFVFDLFLSVIPAAIIIICCLLIKYVLSLNKTIMAIVFNRTT